MSTTNPTSRIRTWLVEYVSRQLEIRAQDVDVCLPFAYYGFRSLEQATLISSLEAWLDLSLSPTLAWEHPSIDQLARHLGAQCA